jgi:hypothetical protein
LYSIEQDITEDLLYSYLTEKQIMEHYLGLPVNFSKIYKVPSFIRYDKKPTGSFYIDSVGRLVFKDFAGGFHGNCVSIAMKKTGLNYYDCLKRIHLELIEGKEVPVIPEEDRIKYEKTPKLIEVKRRKLSESDLLYWGQFGISKETLDLYKVTGLQTLWVNKKIIYANTTKDIGYLYDFNDGIYKAYFPNRSEYRFISNTSSFILQGYNQLPKKGKKLIITKALKDVMTLKELGYDAIAPQAESVLISSHQMVELKSRFKKIVSLMDFDYTGVCLMNKMKKRYGIPPYTLTNGRFYTPNYGAKDISDLVKLIGKDEVKKLIEER